MNRVGPREWRSRYSMMMLVSGIVSPRASSRSTGNLPIPHSLSSAARSTGSPRLTEFGVNGMSFSYSAISAFQQNDDKGWKCSVSDMETPGMEARRTVLRSADMHHANYFAAGAPISFAHAI